MRGDGELMSCLATQEPGSPAPVLPDAEGAGGEGEVDGDGGEGAGEN